MAAGTVSAKTTYPTNHGKRGFDFTTTSLLNNDTLTFASVGVNVVEEIWVRVDTGNSVDGAAKFTVDNTAKTITNTSGGTLAAGTVRVVGH